MKAARGESCTSGEISANLAKLSLMMNRLGTTSFPNHSGKVYLVAVFRLVFDHHKHPGACKHILHVLL